MTKSIKAMQKLDREKYKVPRRVQDLIPVKRIWPDGIFQTGTRYSMSFRFTDINYQVASKEDKERMFLAYSELLNSLDSGSSVKITIHNHRLNQSDFEQSILIPARRDGLDKFRREYNQMLLNKATGISGITQEKYITVSVHKKNIEDARTYFRRVAADLNAHLAALGSRCTALDAVERLRILHSFYRPGEEAAFCYDLPSRMRLGRDFRDYICPDIIERCKDYFKLGDTYARTLYLKDIASYVKDDMVTELTDFNRSMMFSIDILPVPMDEAVREVEKRLLGVETNAANWQRHQNANNNFTAELPHDMELQRREIKEFLNDLTSRDQRMMFALMTMVITADSKEQLDSDTEALQAIARKRMCQLSVLKYQQMDGLNTALPIGQQRLTALRTLTTESLAVFMPFKVQEICEKGGIYLGENAISHNMIFCNMDNLLNQSMVLLGVPGSGKSFLAKLLIVALILSTDADVLVCDPEGEYAALTKALKGSVIHCSANSSDRINAMDMVAGYGDKNPIAAKSQFIMSLIEQIDKTGVGAHQKSIIDRCVEAVYREQRERGQVPTLCTLRDKLNEQPEPEAQGLALALELFTSGSLDVFAHETNVDTRNRLVCYDIHDLGSQLKPAGLLTITDAMLNRVIANAKKGKTTYLIIDEFHVVFENEQSALFFNNAYRQFRKRGGHPCAITQNVEYLLDSVQGSTMLSNSEMVVMLNQAANDRAKLARLLNISKEQLSYITNAEAGSGLLKYGRSLVPFVNRFPKDTKLYKLITTKPSDKKFK